MTRAAEKKTTKFTPSLSRKETRKAQKLANKAARRNGKAEVRFYC